MNDPLGDMLTRIRNAQMRGKSSVNTPASTRHLAQPSKAVGIRVAGQTAEFGVISRLLEILTLLLIFFHKPLNIVHFCDS